MTLAHDVQRAPARTEATPSVATDHLKSIVERIERMEEEIAAANADKSEIYKEAKGAGFDVKVLKKLVALRRRDFTKRREEAAILDLYMQAMGMAE